jgi:pimeloyl-ACP methyl ester carboxylesterase
MRAMTQLQESLVHTRSGAAIAVHEAGSGPHCVFAIGGMSVRSFADSGIRPVLEQACAHGARCVLMDLEGSGGSAATPARTMEHWLDDVDEIFAQRVGVPALWTGASLGGWLMVLAHRRHPAWFRAMYALAPAFDWDQEYVGPRLADGRLGVVDATVVNPDGTALAGRELLVSMSRHHVLRGPVRLSAPMHVVFGLRDELAPAAGTRRFIEAAQGAPCTGEIVPEGDHGIAKLDSEFALVRYRDWLRAQLAVPLLSDFPLPPDPQR